MRHLSISQLNMATRCGEQYRRRYIDGERIPPGIALVVGSAVHEAADVGLSEKLETREDAHEGDVVDAAVTSYDRRIREDGILLTREEKNAAGRLLGEGKDRTVGLARLWRAEVSPEIQPRVIEQKISIDVPELTVPLLGIVDVYEEDGTLRDLKTANKKWRQDRADSEMQPTLYRELIRREFGTAPSRIVYDVLNDSKNEPRQRIETERSAADFEALVRRARAMVALVHAGLFPPAKPGEWWCTEKFCGYWWTCPFISDRQKQLPRTQ